MNGRRIPVVQGQDPFLALQEPGDYYGPVMGFSGDRPAVFFFLPVPGTKRFHHVQSPPHKITEEADGTLTLRDSILGRGWCNEQNQNYEWHGFLTKGEWTLA